MCPSDNKKTFFLFEKGHVRFVEELTKILRTLLRQLKNDKTVTRPSAEQNFSDVKSQNKLLEEKDLKKRLKTLCQKEVKKLVKRKQQPFAKKKKPNKDSELNVPIVTSVKEHQGILIIKDLSNASDFIVNFFDNEDYDDSESLSTVYEVLALPLLDDYLKMLFNYYDSFKILMFNVSSLIKIIHT